MESKAEKAMSLFESGYNCSQAVFGAFCEDYNIDFDTAMLLSSGFGGGMGRMREVCGAVSGAVMVLGLKYGFSDTQNHDKKTLIYKKVQELAGKFKEQNGSIICRELLGGLAGKENTYVPQKRTGEYYKKRPCAMLCFDVAKLLEEELAEK